MKIKFTHFFTALVFGCSSIAYAQQPNVSLVYYDVAGTAQSYAMEHAHDGGYVMAGERNYNALIMKIDSGGAIIWEKEIGNTSSGHFKSLAQTADSGFIAAGYLQTATNDMLCVRCDKNGNILWMRTIDMGQAEEAYRIKQTSDGGYILAGTQFILTAPNHKVIVAKLSSSGALLWSSTYVAGNSGNAAYGISECAGSGYIVTGFTENYPPYDMSAFLLRLDASGNEMWAKKYKTVSGAGLYGFDVIADSSGFVFYGGGGLCNLTKTDTSGNILWSKSYSAFSGSGSINNPAGKLIRLSDGGYIISNGDQISFGTVLRTDVAGNALWYMQPYLATTSVLESAPGKVIVSGNGPIYGVTIYPPTGNPQIGISITDSLANDPWFCAWSSGFFPSTDTMVVYPAAFSASASGIAGTPALPVNNTTLSIDTGCVMMYGSVKEHSRNALIKILPNPSQGKFSVDLKETGSATILCAEIFSSHGKKVWGTENASALASPVDLEHCANGIYFLRIICSDRTFTQRIVISH